MAQESAAAREHLPLFKHLWSLVDDKFNARRILTPEGHAFVQTHAIKGSHPEFPTALNFISLMPALSNGARAHLFPSAASPLFSVFLNINYAQTRKSALTGINDAVGEELDNWVTEVVKAKFDALVQQLAAEGPGPAADLGNGGGAQLEDARGGKGKGKRERARMRATSPEVISCVLRSATAEEFFRRCSGDCEQIANELDVDPELLGRQWYAVLVNLDEAYDLLLSFSLISEEVKPTSNSKARVNPHQSALNKLMQYGRSARATKTSGTYGEANAASVSGGIIGNMHPAQYVSMEKGLSGSHVVACKERFLVGTGRPVQPHEALPSEYSLPDGTSRWTWVPLNRFVAEILCLAECLDGPGAVEQKFKPAAEDEIPPTRGVDAQHKYLPHRSGYIVKLPDGVESRVRFVQNADSPTGFDAEWRISNRDFAIPTEHRLRDAVRRCTKYFSTPRMEIKFEPRARQTMLSYQGQIAAHCHNSNCLRLV